MEWTRSKSCIEPSPAKSYDLLNGREPIFICANGNIAPLIKEVLTAQASPILDRGVPMANRIHKELAMRRRELGEEISL